MKIFDLTNNFKLFLVSNKHHIRFNPSILHLDKNKYLLSYRLYVSDSNIDLKKLNIKTAFFNGTKKWQSLMETTVIAELQYVHKWIINKERIIIPNNKNDKTNTVVDSRLFKKNSNDIYLSFNTSVNPDLLCIRQKNHVLVLPICTYISKAKYEKFLSFK